MTAYIQRSTASDLSVPGEYDLQLLEDAATEVSHPIELAGSATAEGYHYTEAGIPGADGVTGDYSVKVDIAVGDAQIFVSAAVARVNSSGAVQQQTAFSTEQQSTGDVQTHNFTNANLGTWASGDRLRVAVRYRNNHSMPRSMEVAFNTTDAEVVTPWGEAEPDPAEGSGEIASVGALEGAGLAPSVGAATGSGQIMAVGSLSGDGSSPSPPALSNVREFDRVDDNIITATGALSGMTFGTVAVLIKRNFTTQDWLTWLCFHNSGGTPSGDFAFDGSSSFAPVYWVSGSGSIGSATSNNVWYLIVYRKPTGSATGRWSVFNYNTSTWTHVNGSASQGNFTAPGVSGTTRFSFQTGDLFGGRVAARAAWSNTVKWATNSTGDAEIVASGMHTSLQSWVDTDPSALWAFNQASVTDPVEDLTGGGADETSRTGTAVITDDAPPGFDFSLESEPPQSGSGTVTTVGALTGSGATTRTGHGEISAEGLLEAQGSVQHSGSGSLVAEGSLLGDGDNGGVDTFTVGSNVVQANITLSPSGSGNIETIGHIDGSGLTQRSGSGSVDAIGILDGQGFAPTVGVASGSGEIAAEGILEGQGFAPLVEGAGGFGHITAVGTLEGSGATSRTGSGSVTTEGLLDGHGATQRSGQGDITAVGQITGHGQSADGGGGSVTAVADITAAGSTDRSGSGSVSAVGTLEGAGATTRQGAGSVSAEGHVEAQGSTERSGSGDLTAVGRFIGNGQSADGGGGTIAAVADALAAGFTERSGSGQTTAQGIVEGQGETQRSGSGSVVAETVLTGSGQAPTVPASTGSGTIQATGHTEFVGLITTVGSGEIASEGLLEGNGFVERSGSGEVVSIGIVAGDGLAIRSGSSEIEGILIIDVVGREPAIATVFLKPFITVIPPEHITTLVPDTGIVTNVPTADLFTEIPSLNIKTDIPILSVLTIIPSLDTVTILEE